MFAHRGGGGGSVHQNTNICEKTEEGCHVNANIRL